MNFKNVWLEYHVVDDMGELSLSNNALFAVLEALHGVTITGGAIVGGIAGVVGAALYLGYKVLRR